METCPRREEANVQDAHSSANRHVSANQPQQTIVFRAYPECVTKVLQKRSDLDPAGTDSAKVVETVALQVCIICDEVSKVGQ